MVIPEKRTVKICSFPAMSGQKCGSSIERQIIVELPVIFSGHNHKLARLLKLKFSAARSVLFQCVFVFVVEDKWKVNSPFILWAKMIGPPCNRSLNRWGVKVTILKIEFCSEVLWLSVLP